MGIRLSPSRLDRELARRGWSATDLARATGCSPSTISGARRGRVVNNETLRRIAEALRGAPIILGVDALLDPEDGMMAEENGGSQRAAAHKAHT